jgi:hypothetical protein
MIKLDIWKKESHATVLIKYSINLFSKAVVLGQAPKLTLPTNIFHHSFICRIITSSRGE